MPTLRITKEFSFEGAHALVGYDGKCRHIHGHSYKLHVTVKGSPSTDCSSPKLGMLMDFTDLKRIVNETVIGHYDHALVMKEGAPLSQEIENIYQNVITVPFQPTSENMTAHFAALISCRLPAGIQLVSLKLHETATSYVEWFASDNAQ